MTPLQIFQKKIGVNPDNDFGKVTLKAGIKFLKLTNEQGAHFFAQVAHETGEFRLFKENLNYSASGLRKVFGKYFPNNVIANQYARKPQKIANRVYANRMGNGNEASNDGWTYRGRGALQLTGKNNYHAFFDYLDKCFPVDLVATDYAFDSALFYFKTNNLWRKCKTVTDSSIISLTKSINGGTNGLAHRRTLTYKYYNWLK